MVIERSGDTAFDYSLHDGQGTASVQWHFQGESQLPVAVQTWVLPPGGTEGVHAHPPDEPLEELYLVLEGQAAITIDGQVFELGIGDAALAPVASEHDVRNVGDTELRLMVVWGRPAPADWEASPMTRAARQARRQRP